MPLERRRVLVREGSDERVDVDAVRAAVGVAEPAPTPIDAPDESRLAEPSAELLAQARAAWGEGALDAASWGALGKLERFALLHLASRHKPSRLREALDEMLAPQSRGAGLTHVSASGEASMVDVGAKPITHRRAIASARVRMRPDTARRIVEGSTAKGDVLAAARLAGIMAAKRTPELVPLCHTVALARVAVSFDVDPAAGLVTIKTAADAHDRTGVEMEAMVAASVAALTLYDMLKAVERGICIEEVVLLEKQGGRSGHYRREPDES
jgi:cyclic pyranopterin phosphate synthase